MQICNFLTNRILYFTLSFVLMECSVGIKEGDCSHGQCDFDILLGNLRLIPEKDITSVSVEDQLWYCRQESSNNTKIHSNRIKNFVEESQKVNINMENTAIKAQSEHTRLQKKLDDKLIETQRLRQDLLTKDLLLSRKFDCSKSNIFAELLCKRYCNFPYDLRYENEKKARAIAESAIKNLVKCGQMLCF